MNSSTYKLILLGCIFGCILSWFTKPNKEGGLMISYITKSNDLIGLFPKTAQQIDRWEQNAYDNAEKSIKKIIALPLDKLTFDTTFRAFDNALAAFSRVMSVFDALSFVHPDDELRNEAQHAATAMRKYAVEVFNHNKALYMTLKLYADTRQLQEELTSEQRYFIAESMQSFKRDGLDLPHEKREQVIKLHKELAELTAQFEKNIAEDIRTIEVQEDDLAGLSADFIAALRRSDQGGYLLGIDYPTYQAVMEQCSVTQTRKKLHQRYHNRAYPANQDVLHAIIAKRHELAEILGFSSYAHLNLEPEMVKTPEQAEQFLRDLINKASCKQKNEFQELVRELPAGIELTAEGKMYPWDSSYVRACYKMKHYNLDETLVAEYFPAQKTMEGLLDIYRTFFSLSLQEKKVSGLWDPEVKVIEVARADDHKLLGYLLVDLYPRPNKYTHACQMTLIPALSSANSVAVALVIANFPKSTATKPALLKRSDVKTFFHEFGHALHALLGATELASCSGTNVKTDFVEMPSQMLEEWLLDKEILKKISSHYQTGNPLPDDLIDSIICLKNFGSGLFIAQQGFYSLLALACFKEGTCKDLKKITKELQQELLLHHEYCQDDNMHTSFGHLMGYGAKYYGYLWSKVYALDLFAHIKKFGLLNPEIGNRYREKVLAVGGSKDPSELLIDFLGRAPNQEAFLADLGL